jgi:transglutaminase-like putative cysteine protease
VTKNKGEEEQPMNTQDHSSSATAGRRQDEVAAPINTRTAWRPWLKPIGRLLIAAQLALVLQPLSVAAQEKVLNPSMAARSSRSPAEQISDKLAQAQELVAQLRSQYTSDKASKHQQLRSLLEAIRMGAADVRDDFAAIRSELQRKNASEEILTRHDETVAHFEQRALAFSQIVSTSAGDEERVNRLEQFFRRYPGERRHAPIDPSKLPWGSPKTTPRMPAETQAAWFHHLYSGEKVLLAQAPGATSVGGVWFTTPPEPELAPADADLAETPDVQLTPAIRTKASELGYNPANIARWVTNSVEWLPTWGSIQGADATLKTLKGNAVDTASLTIALLRASGIPARYQFGTVEVPVAQAMNWLGGLQRPEAALDLLHQGGIAARGLSSGGRIVAIRMEHVWVSAYVNWMPGRGVRQGGATIEPPLLAAHGQPQHPHPNARLNHWLPIDGSFKQYSYSPGMPVGSAVPMDGPALLEQALEGSTTTPSFVRRLNQPNIQAALLDYQERLEQYIASSASGTNSTFADVFGAKVIQQRPLELMPGSTPLAVVVQGGQRAELPEHLRWKITLKLYGSLADKANDSPLASSTLSLPQIGTRRISAVSIGATEADRNLLQQYAASDATALPLYLIKQRVRLQLDDIILAEASPRTMGAEQWWSYALYGPAIGTVEEDFKYETAVGDAIVFGIDGAGVSLNEVRDRFSAVDPNTAFENLHHVNLGYFARANASDQALGQAKGFVAVRLPSVGLFASPMTIQYSWGIPRKGTFASYAVDIRRLSQATVSKRTAAMGAVDFNVQLGLKNSYLEGAIFEEIFGLSRGRGISAVSVMSEANYAGVGVHEISAANLSEYLSTSGLSSGMKEAIAAYTAAGYSVLAPDSFVTTPNWRAQAYIAIDQQTGAGAYIISSGANGGELLECEEKTEPLTKTIGDKIMTWLVIAAAAALIAAGLAAAPTTGGGSLGGSGVAVAKMMAVFGMTYLVFSADANAAKNCATDKCHRGTIQAQGFDILNKGNTLSASWANVKPLTVREGLELLNALKEQLSPAQLTARATYFAEAEAWILSRPPAGVCGGGPTRSFGPNPANKDHVKNQIRVDIKVYAGEAFSQ